MNSYSKPTIVLVHGAFAESSSWNDVISRLHTQGYTAVSASVAIRTVAADVDYVNSIVKSIGGPVVLVGHSYGGAVITGAGRDDENVKALVYIAGFAPDTGENIGELSSRFPGATLGETLWTVPLADGSNDLYIQQDKYHNQFAADVPAAVTALMAATQRPLSDISTTEAFVGTPAWKQVPSWFLLPELDRNIPVASHRFMAERAGARETVEIAGASHAVGVSHPDEVADMILRAAASIETAMRSATAVAA